MWPRPTPGSVSDRTTLVEFYTQTSTFVAHRVPNSVPFVGVATNATAVAYAAVYACHFGWLAVLLAAAAALALMSVASLALRRRRVLAPDMLRGVAGRTYDNAFFGTPPGGSALDGMARSLLLRDVSVRISDDQDHGEVGRVAFVATACKGTARLQNDRLYA